jgi:nicotinate phosphoribosyltransferase
MLTDFYQVTISRNYFEEGRQDEPAVFDLFFRIPPFSGSFAVFAGLSEAIEMIRSYKLSEEDLQFLRENLPGVSDGFIDYLRNIDTKKLKITAFPEGSIVFPREPLLRVEGPVAYCQLIETPLLNAVNYPTLMTTNALRFRLHAGPGPRLMEFGLRRAQGPDGGLCASRYSYIGGFDCTSNVLAGKIYKIPIAGTVAHSFVCSYSDVSQLKTKLLKHATEDRTIDLWEEAHHCLKIMGWKTNPAELVAYVSQARVTPASFVALVDTYDSMKSGVPNFLAVAYALWQAGYKAIGIRLDSGSLSTLSRATREMFVAFGEKFQIPFSGKFIISASNDINEGVLEALAHENHSIDSFGIGTNLVTCQRQPALGAVYKLVEISGIPRMKVSDSVSKSSLPCRKDVFRLYDASNVEIADIMTIVGEVPDPGEISAFEVFPQQKPVKIVAASVKRLIRVAWENGCSDVDDIETVKGRVREARDHFNSKVLAVRNQESYHVLISKDLHAKLEELVEKAKAVI